MAYTRKHLLAKWSAGTVLRAFPVLIEGFGGAATTYPKQVSRNPDGDLLEVRATSKERFVGAFILDESDTGTVTYDAVVYTKGQIADVKAMYAATDLQIKRQVDSDFFNASTLGDIEPSLYTPKAEVQAVLVTIVEK